MIDDLERGSPEAEAKELGPELPGGLDWEPPEKAFGEEGIQAGPRPRNPLGYRSRLERRTYKRARRQRQRRLRTWLSVVPALVLIGVVVAVLVLAGGPEAQAPVLTTVVTEKTAPDTLLVVQEGGIVPVLVVLHPREEGGGTVLGIPGITLVRVSGEGFATLSELAAGQTERLLGALREALGISVKASTTEMWDSLRNAMRAAGVNQVPPASLDKEGKEAEQLARAVLALRQATVEARLSGAMADVLYVGGLASDEWTVAALEGERTKGPDFVYLEPDVDQAKQALAGRAENLHVAVQVQNGSGAVGLAEQAVDLLTLLGYELLPSANAKGFPDVLETYISCAPDVRREAEKVQQVLGIWRLFEDSSLASGQVIVVLGKDWVPPLASAEAPDGEGVVDESYTQ